MAFEYTEQQKQAILSPIDRNTVVTAAAGSGKTTLLVDRVIRIISDRETNIPADSLAIMTFTRNAADNLRMKINRRLGEKLESLGDDEDELRGYLAEQIIKLRSASIGTIDSFCINVIRENVQIFDLPVNFAVADNARKASMQAQAMQAVMDYFYGSPAPDGDVISAEDRDALFFTFSFENDDALRNAITDTAESLSSYDGASEWLEEEAAANADLGRLGEKYLPIIIKNYEKLLHKANLELHRLARINAELSDFLSRERDNAALGGKDALAQTCGEVLNDYNLYYIGCLHTAELVEAALGVLREKNDLPALDEFSDTLSKITNTAELPRKGPKSELRKQFTDSKNKFAKHIESMRAVPFSYEEERNIIEQQSAVVATFVKLVRFYISAYSSLKISSGYPDFSDCELMLLDRLKNNEEFRKGLSDRFSCIIVDEFQDSNNVQADIFRLISNGKNNLFYVGDVKQAIYTFRGGDPRIMAALCDGAEGFGVIPLNRNFRSRRAVIDSVNCLFSGIMTREYGDVDYENGSQLECGADYPEIPPEKAADYCTEIHMLDLPELESEPESDFGDIRQAHFVAGKIKALLESGFEVSDGKGGMRQCRYSDFSVLLRKNGNIKAYKEALNLAGIPALTAGGRDFLESEEITLVMDLLRVIDNPLCDEEFLRVLMSPLYSVSAADAAKIRLGALGISTGDIQENEDLINPISRLLRYFSLYGCLNYCIRAAESTDDNNNPDSEAADTDTAAEAAGSAEKARLAERELKKRGVARSIGANILRFAEDIHRYRFFKGSSSVEGLIRRIYSETDLISIVSAYDGGKQRAANLRLLRKYAADFEERDGGSLSDFIRFVANTKAYRQRMEEAGVPDDAENAVRIMTFHASKGLEMPICILAELDYRFSQNDMRGTVIMNHDAGLGLSYVDRKLRYKSGTLSSEALKIVNREKIYGEELRLLYVAATRAQEKLIMVGASTKAPSELVMTENDAQDAFRTTSPFQWILSSMLRYADAEQFPFFGDNSPLELFDRNTHEPINTRIYYSTVNDADIISEEITQAEKEAEQAPEETPPDADSVTNEETEALKNVMLYEYPYASDTAQQAKYAVTELAHQGDDSFEQSVVYLTKPSFYGRKADEESAANATGKEIGDAYHHIMEHFPIDAIKGACSDEERAEITLRVISRLADENKITRRETALVIPERIAAFFGSELGRRMLKSSRVEREKAFYAELPAARFDPACSGEVSIQGRTDMYFYEDGGIVLVDYKSDSAANLEKETLNYAKQLSIYSDILPEVTGVKVKQMYLYAFSTGECIDVEKLLDEQKESENNERNN